MCSVVVDSLFDYFDLLVMYTTIIWLPAVHKFHLNVIILVFEIHIFLVRKQTWDLIWTFVSFFSVNTYFPVGTTFYFALYYIPNKSS